jgi:uncharacterized protein (TIGR01244 family)
LKHVLTIVAAAALACAAACSVETNEGGAKATAGTPSVETTEIPGVGTVRKVGDDLLFAGQPSPDGIRTLAGQGVRTVLNTRGEGELDWDEAALVSELGLTYVTIPMAYPIESIPDEWVARFDEVMADADRPVLLHCSSGNRVAGLWAVWLAERKDVPDDEALELGKKAGMTRIGPVVKQRLEGGEG